MGGAGERERVVWPNGAVGQSDFDWPRARSRPVECSRMFTLTMDPPGVATDAVRERAITQPEAQEPACRTAKCGAGGRHRSIIAFPECQASSALPLRQRCLPW